MQIARIGGGSTGSYSAKLVGSKAANLARVAALGLPVPPAFVLPISLCAATLRGDDGAAQDLADGLSEGLAFLEEATGKRFADRRRPLLVSVRSGAAQSMPGMLDTVLNVGCTVAAVRGLVRMSGRPRFASDCRRRLLESYGNVVFGIDPAAFVRKRSELIASEHVSSEYAFDCEALERLAVACEQVISDYGHILSEDPMDQLKEAVQAVFRSWMSNRACTYRKLQHLEHLQGTAVTVQAMVFGNAGSFCGAGVAFSRDPSTGSAKPIIEVMFDTQGEDVVSGTHNPDTEQAIARSLPEVAAQLSEALARLEQDFADIQDVEFTIENGKLWILQTRAAKRTPLAALRFAVDFVKEGRIAPAEALRRLNGFDLRSLVTERLVISSEPVGRGIGASAGVAVGRAVFDSDSAARLSASGGSVILVRPEMTTADIGGFAVSAGIVTATGGRTAHAALVARQMGKPCVAGCAQLAVDVVGRCAQLAGAAINEGDWLSIDGEMGTVYRGRGDVLRERPEAALAEIEAWRHNLRSATSSTS